MLTSHLSRAIGTSTQGLLRDWTEVAVWGEAYFMVDNGVVHHFGHRKNKRAVQEPIPCWWNL